MEIIGLDLHKRESQLSIKADDGSITDRRIAVGGRQIATRHDASTMQPRRHVNRTPHVPTIGVAIVLQHQQQALTKW